MATFSLVRRSALALGSAALASLLAAGSAAAQAAADYRAFADSLDRLPELGAQAATVTELALRRDRGTITLTGGRLYRLAPLGGRTVALLYEGAGRLELEPPHATERRLLARYHRAEKLDAQFEHLVLLFADESEAALASLSWDTAEVPGALKRRWRENLDFVSDYDNKTLDADLALPLINGTQNGFFHGFAAGGRLGEPVVLRISPNEVESVQLLSRARGTGFVRYMEPATQFRPLSDSGAPPASDRRAGVRVRHYALDATLDRTGGGDVSFTASGTLDIVADTAMGPWLAFGLYKKLTVDSAQWGDGTPAPFYKNKDGYLIWVRLPAPLARGDEAKLRLWYRGDLVDRFGDWFVIKSSASWYPRTLEGRSMATFDITFRTPKNYQIASVGRRTDSTVSGQVLTTRWVSEAPLRNAGFNLGLLEEYRVAEPDAPPVTVLWSEKGHKEIAQAALARGDAAGLPSSSGKKEVGADIAKSLKFFSHVFGPAAVDHFYATEIPGGHGEAFPGLVHLSWVTFMSTDRQGTDEWFRAHEVAHQWWGIGVDFATYRDQWLSEGLSSFAGLWYLQTVRKDNKQYFGMLDRWRPAIVRRAESGGPISLGYRNATADAADDYQNIVYYKGAWVIHMLRVMMLDFRTMNEDRFTNMMRDFYSTYRGRRASTDDFRLTAEKHMGVGLGWFFDQWVHGTAIPSYRASYETENLPNGQVKMTVRVRQENVPADFEAYVPVTVELDGDQVFRTRIRVRGAETVSVLPVLPGKPKKFIFNDFSGVLAR